MAHQQQIDFCTSVKHTHSEFFSKRIALDIGSLDINGNNQYLFDDCQYIGVDLMPGRNVDFASKGHELNFPSNSIDVVISSECFEHDQHYAETLKNIVRMLKPGGLFLFTCATTGRPEHGTRRTTPMDAPFTQHFSEWGDYYKNLEEFHIREVLEIEDIFSSFQFSICNETHDLYFWGVRKGILINRLDYSFLLNHSTLKDQITTLSQTTAINDAEIARLNQILMTNDIEIARLTQVSNEQVTEIKFIKSSFSWRFTKLLRAIDRLLRN